MRVAATAPLTRVGLPQRRPQIPDSYLGVDRRGFDAAVAQETLDVAHVGTAGKKVRRAGVPKRAH
jgi:hypothetical protein